MVGVYTNTLTAIPLKRSLDMLNVYLYSNCMISIYFAMFDFFESIPRNTPFLAYLFPKY